MNRRNALSSLLAGGTVLSLASADSLIASESKKVGNLDDTLAVPQERNSSELQENSVQEPEPEADFDRLATQKAGFTEQEYECWKLLAEAAGKFFALPELHPSDNSEVATAVHVIQNKLLARPTYRTYITEAKRLRGEK